MIRARMGYFNMKKIAQPSPPFSMVRREAVVIGGRMRGIEVPRSSIVAPDGHLLSNNIMPGLWLEISPGYTF